MPYIILFAFIVVGVGGYMYFSKNQEKYTAKKPKENDPFDISYLSGNIKDVDESEQTDQS